ncbi:MAG: type IV pilin protein [Colwellia sp.]
MTVIKSSKLRGFTLIEVLITVAIIGIIAGIAFPSYTDFVNRSNRTEGQRELMRLANLQEQYFVDNRTYTTDMTKLGMAADPYLTENGHYSIDSTTQNTGTSFILTATAKGSQATKDTDCTTMTITETGQKGAESTTCWE